MPFHIHWHRKLHVSWVSETSSPAAHFPAKHKFDRQLQSGSEGDVQQWTHKATGTTLAVKVIKYTKLFPSEVQILRHLPPHGCIIQYLGYYEKQPSPEKSSIILEYCPEGDLFTLIDRMRERNGGIFSEGFMWSVYSQLAAALAFLHEGIDTQNPLGRDNWRPVVHRDIKTENVLVRSVGGKDDWSDIDVKLGDYGMAGYYDPAHPNPLGQIGTAHNWPPEISWETKGLSPASDVWGIAAILHELAHGFGPVVSPGVTEKKWFAENIWAPYPDYWLPVLKMSYWEATTPRRVIPVNLKPEAPLPTDPRLDEPDERVERCRKHRPSPKYSDALNDCMMMALRTDPQERAGAGVLLSEIEEAHAEFLFQDLKIEHDCETEVDGNESDGQD
ncbi:kinase-like protein [Cucurbitaria berberidis CBS 394.84]|uniref:non-specific serine/threonine protein kinase n=1 Tax=Cucurbitaria berberidis CBS 394.84 TaxID=1168544 RepID=A0A9P4L3C5_9PLEO|nr:kinase-like protein [Cucurbitaria berberidis CBS 394.84]KAF1840157.1 kinase-like protein [Cucurbitaria berberidis CBS 394.84]